MFKIHSMSTAAILAAPANETLLMLRKARRRIVEEVDDALTRATYVHCLAMNALLVDGALSDRNPKEIAVEIHRKNIEFLSLNHLHDVHPLQRHPPDDDHMDATTSFNQWMQRLCNAKSYDTAVEQMRTTHSIFPFNRPALNENTSIVGGAMSFGWMLAAQYVIAFRHSYYGLHREVDFAGIVTNPRENTGEASRAEFCVIPHAKDAHLFVVDDCGGLTACKVRQTLENHRSAQECAREDMGKRPTRNIPSAELRL
jgi:hypothetical protein